jgi:hypothetical protein
MNVTAATPFRRLLALVLIAFAAACNSESPTSPNDATYIDPLGALGAAAVAPCTITLAPAPGGNSAVVAPWTPTGACNRFAEIQAFPNAGYTFSHWVVSDAAGQPLPPVYVNRYAFYVTQSFTFYPVFNGTPPAPTCDLVAGDSTLVADAQNTNISLVGAGCVNIPVYGIGAFNWGPYTGQNGSAWPLQRRPFKKGLQGGTYRVVAEITATQRDTVTILVSKP